MECTLFDKLSEMQYCDSTTAISIFKTCDELVLGAGHAQFKMIHTVWYA